MGALNPQAVVYTSANRTCQGLTIEEKVRVARPIPTYGIDTLSSATLMVKGLPMKERPTLRAARSGTAPDRSIATRTTARGSEPYDPVLTSPKPQAPLLCLEQCYPGRVLNIVEANAQTHCHGFGKHRSTVSVNSLDLPVPCQCVKQFRDDVRYHSLFRSIKVPLQGLCSYTVP